MSKRPRDRTTSKIRRLNPREIPQAMSRALALHQQGQLSAANALYQAVLDIRSTDFDALHLSGVIAAQTGQAEAGAQLITRALDSEPRHPAAYAAQANLGSAHRKCGRTDAALQSYEHAISLRGDYGPALVGRADMLRDLQRYEDALLAYESALVVLGRQPGLLQGRGHVLARLKRWNEALASYDEVLQLDRQSAELYSNRAAALLALDRAEEALESCDRAISCSRSHAEAHANRASALKRLGRLEEALESGESASNLCPHDVAMHSNCAAILLDLARWQPALERAELAIGQDPNHAEAHGIRALALQALRRWDEAHNALERAIGLQPTYAEAYLNFGNLMKDQRQFEAALPFYEKAIALRGDYAEAHLNRAMLLLLRGEFSAGWPEYEWRWETRDGAQRRTADHFAQPAWLGDSSIAGRRLLLHCEQGAGDTIQFCRFATLAARAGALVLLRVQPELVRLLKGVEGVSEIVAKGAVLPDFDLRCPLLSLPLAFGTTIGSIPAPRRYLVADSQWRSQWAVQLGYKTRPRVGLVWSGNPKHPNDRNRSMPFSAFREHLPVGVQYVSLQKEIRETDRSTLAQWPELLDANAGIRDFADTAALCEELDLVITVDTSVAHLSGALGVPTWILLPDVPDWRWMLGRSDSPWYPSATLYRQSRSDSWDELLEQVGCELSARFSSLPPVDSRSSISAASTDAGGGIGL